MQDRSERIGTSGHRERHDGWTGEKKRAFLDALANCGNVRDACRAVGLSSTSAYRMRRIDPAFGTEWDAALARAAVSLEAIAFQRATEGAEEIVIREGKEVSRRRKPSDAIFRMILQASNPEKYGRTGNQASVRAREDVEARVREIEQRAYRAAWLAFTTEYNYRCEPEYVRHHLIRKLHIMHTRMCGNATCEECHPERHWKAIDARKRTTVPEDHQPVPPPDDWLAPMDEMINRQRRAIDPKAPPFVRKPPERPEALSRWFEEVQDALMAERAEANRAGRDLELGNAPTPSGRKAPPLRYD